MQGLRAFQRYFDFSGRSGRAEYWQFVGIITGAFLIALFIDMAVGNPANPILTIIVGLTVIIPGYAVTTRRAHDRGLSGWWIIGGSALALSRLVVVYAAQQNAYTDTGDVLGTLAKVLGYVVLALNGFFLVQFVQRSQPNTNRYGPVPGTFDDPAPSVGHLIDRAKQAGWTAAAPSSAPSRTVDVDPLEQIKRLAELRDAGALTEAEFTEQKAALLSRL